MTKITTVTAGSPKSGFGNTVPLFSSTHKQYGVWNQLEGKFVNTSWHATAEEAIEAYDDLVMANIKAGKKIDTAPPAPFIKRERNGEKAVVAKKYSEQYPNLGLQEVANLAHREMTNVSVANFRYLINKVRSA